MACHIFSPINKKICYWYIVHANLALAGCSSRALAGCSSRALAGCSITVYCDKLAVHCDKSTHITTAVLS